jgi:hypothetical protein
MTLLPSFLGQIPPMAGGYAYTLIAGSALAGRKTSNHTSKRTLEIDSSNALIARNVSSANMISSAMPRSTVGSNHTHVNAATALPDTMLSLATDNAACVLVPLRG